MLALGLGLLLALIFFPRMSLGKETKALLGIFAVATGVIVFISLVPGLQKTFLEPLLAKKESFAVTPDKTLPLDSAWRISTQAVGQRPFFGVGPGTFAYSFTALKGPELNSDDYWNLRFDLSGNEYLTMLSTIGIVGIIGFVLILLVLARNLLTFNYRSEAVRENPLSAFLLASLVVFLVGIFFQDTTATIWVFFVLLAATTFSYLKELGVKNVEEVDVKLVALTSGGVQFSPANDRARDTSSLGTGVTILGVAAFLLILYFGLPTYQAEISYQKALVASTKDKAADTRDLLLDAVNKNPNRDTYRRSLVVLDRLIATNLSQKADKTDQDNRNIAGLVSEAVEQGTRITGYEGRGLNNFTVRRQAGTSPLNVANWEALTGVLSSLQLEGDDKNRNAANAINVASQAVALDPRNPVLHETLGNILLANNLVDNAIQAYERAVSVRPAYTSAHYNLANALKQKGGNEARVVLELQNTLTLLPEDSQDRDRVSQELEEATQKYNQATSSATNR
jgi:tetratricopeptide (TPR) repeat protein